MNKQSIRASIIAGGLALVVITTAMPAPVAQAQTLEDLQAQITALMARIAQLQGQTSTSGQTATMCPYTWTRTLNIGSSGPDVKKLQQFLNSDPTTQIAASGIGSKGQETEYYGALTGAAVAKFQNKYRSEVLTPIGLTTGTAFFGNATKAKMNELCVVAQTPVTPSTPSTPTTPSTPSTPSTEVRGDEAVLNHFKTSSGDDTSLEEGQKNVSVMDVEFDIQDSDITVNRVDVAFEHVLGEEDQPWKTFDKVILYVDGDEVATKSVTSKNDWTKDSPYDGAYRVRFSGLALKFKEKDDALITVGLTVAKSVDGARDGLSWDLFIPDNGIRLTDDSKATQDIGGTDQKVNIDITEEGADDELSIKTSDQDPESQTLILKTNTTSGWTKVFAFELDTDDSTNDIEIRELPVSLTVSTATVNTFVRDARLVIDGETFTDVTITDGQTNTMVFEFDNNELVIDAGDTATVELEVKFRALPSVYEGATIYGSANADNIEAEGADDLKASQLSGAATGDEHPLRTFGLNTSNKTVATKTLGSNDTIGEYTIQFTVKAFEGDFYIAPFASTTADTSNGGVKFTVEGTNGFSGVVSAVLDSTAKETNAGIFTVREGKSETFTLTVTVDPDAAGQYRVTLDNVRYSADLDGITNVKTHSFNPITNYRTKYTFVNN